MTVFRLVQTDSSNTAPRSTRRSDPARSAILGERLEDHPDRLVASRHPPAVGHLADRGQVASFGLDRVEVAASGVDRVHVLADIDDVAVAGLVDPEGAMSGVVLTDEIDRVEHPGHDLGRFLAGIDDGVRALAFRELIPKFTGAVQPVVDQGVNSVTGEANPIWTVGGRTESAQIGLDGLTEQSAIMRELAHDVYTNSLGRGHDVNELLKDIVDLALLGTKNPIGLIFSIQTRLQQVLIDTAATSVLSGAMTCTRDAALLSGEFAFQPDRPVYVCEVPVPLDLGDFFRRLFTEKDGGKHYVGRLPRRPNQPCLNSTRRWPATAPPSLPCPTR